MNTVQAIGYYTFEAIACIVIIVVLGFVLILSLGALVERYHRIFDAADDAADAGAATVKSAATGGVA